MSEFRWLTDEEQQTWRVFLDATSKFFEVIEQDLQHKAGVPHTYYEVLVSLSEAPERRLRMSELAANSRSSRSRLSHAVDRLESRGWVTREACPDDKRGAFATLTDQGFAALEAAAPSHVTSVRRHLFDKLTPEQVGQLADISRAIQIDSVERRDDDCPPELP